MRSLARISFDRLLEMHSTMNVLKVEWQKDGPWILVELGQPSVDYENGNEAHAVYSFAIFKRTGAVHGIHDGAVTDEPLISV